ncbi:MAG TPA: hypothetical protein VHU90_05535 [Galbitalea sp.]|jgi:hypothetical protein|nr:hypothetical protein [Galbitalea sp.]
MVSSVYTAEDAAYWYAPLARAVPAAALACVITFAGGFYTPEYGLASFGGYAIVIGVLGVVLSFTRFPGGVLRTVFLIQAIVSVAAGAVALIGVHGGLPVLLVVVALWGIIAGFLELYAGVRSRGKRAVARDWIFVGALTVLFAVVCLVIPPGYVQHYNAPGDGGSRILNASVMVVGAMGIYGAVVAVYLAIAGFSLRFGATANREDVASKEKAAS